METNIAKLLIYLQGHSNEAVREAVGSVLRSDPGVVSVLLPKGNEHLVTVGYDPDRTDSLHLLQLADSRDRLPQAAGL